MEEKTGPHVRTGIALRAIVGAVFLASGAGHASDLHAGNPADVARVGTSNTASPLTLEGAIEEALRANPAIRAADERVAAARGELQQAILLPNPDVDVEGENLFGTGVFEGVDRAQTTLRIAQPIEAPSKRGARRDAADRRQVAAARELDHRRREIAAEVAERFFHVLADRQRLERRTEAMGIAQQALETVRRRVEAGAASELETRKAEIDLERVRIGVEHAEHELAAARRRLTAIVRGDADASLGSLAGDLFSRRSPPAWEELVARIDDAPELVWLRAEGEGRRADVGLAETGKLPDVTLTGGVRHDEGSGDQSVVVGFRLPLPVFDRNQGEAAAARARAREADQRSRKAKADFSARLFGGYQELLHAGQELDSLEQAVLPAARDALAIARRGFADGRFSFLEVLDARRTYLEVHEQRIGAAAEYQTHLVRIEQMTGGHP